MTDITIPDGVTSIRSRAFNGCEKLGSITFTGNTAPELEADDVFGKCAALTAIHVPCGADGYTAANGWPEDKVQKSEHRMARHLRVPRNLHHPTEPSSTGGALCAAATS